jgi:L-alanine-DL-glutamate epimerase-like enolase superfamily enzyme
LKGWEHLVKIREVTLQSVVQPFQDKTWKFALGSVAENRGILVEIQTEDDVVGLGYVTAALHVGEVLDGIRQVLTDLFTPRLVGRDPFDIEPIMSDLDAVVLGYPRTKASIEVALWDIVGKATGVPLYKLWGGLYRESIPVVRIIPIKEPTEMARNAERVVADGFRYLKIKVGVDPELDVARVREVRQAVGPDVGLTLDANQGWTPKAAISALRRMEPFDIALVEQPVRADDHAGLATVRSAVGMLVEADESARTVADVFHLARAGCVDAVSLKTPKLGGPINVKRAVGICDAANLRCRIGMGGASRIIAAVDMHLIASSPSISYACEVGEFSRMEFDATAGVEIDDGMLFVPHGPGHGASIRDGVVAGR